MEQRSAPNYAIPGQICLFVAQEIEMKRKEINSTEEGEFRVQNGTN